MRYNVQHRSLGPKGTLKKVYDIWKHERMALNQFKEKEGRSEYVLNKLQLPVNEKNIDKVDEILFELAMQDWDEFIAEQEFGMSMSEYRETFGYGDPLDEVYAIHGDIPGFRG